MPPKGKGPPKKENESKREKKSFRFRPLPEEVSACLNNLGSNFNFGLYFNKWLWVTKLLEYKFQARPRVKSLSRAQQNDLYQVDEVLENYKKTQSILNECLIQKHRDLDAICEAFQKIGYQKKEHVCELKTPLIIGLGNAHPTERGFTFHWTLGLPYIPAEGIKGVVRLAYLVNLAEEDDNFFEHWAAEDETFWEKLAKPFGRAEKESGAKRGKVIFLDALPKESPELTLEITTCHYSDYYRESRGPTEDQQPIPLPFLAVKPGVKFRFVLLMDKDLGEEDKEKLLKAFEVALTEHGFGAKTALGHGRFRPNVGKLGKEIEQKTEIDISKLTKNPRFKLVVKKQS